MVNFYIKAQVENDPVEAISNRLTQYLTKEGYKLSHRQENYILFTKKNSSWFLEPLPMEEESSIRIDFERTDSNGHYALSLHLSIDVEILPEKHEHYWSAFAKSMEELISIKQTLSKEHHEIKETYFREHPELARKQFPKFYIVFIIAFLYLIIAVVKVVFGTGNTLK